MMTTYVIHRQDSLSASAFIPCEINPTEQEAILKQEWQAALLNVNCLEDGRMISYPCAHIYTNVEVFPKKESSEPLIVKQISKLKGRYLLVASAAASCGLNIYLGPYLYHEWQGGRCELRLKKSPKKKCCPNYTSEETVERFFEGERKQFYDDYPRKHADLWIFEYGEDDEAEKEVCETENYNAKGYLGNQ
jgi:hypothetical protein